MNAAFVARVPFAALLLAAAVMIAFILVYGVRF
jgi:hypothetical protein